MRAADFQQKWIGVTLKECSASQEHFIDLRYVVVVDTPLPPPLTGRSTPSNAVPPNSTAAIAGRMSGSGASLAGNTRANAPIPRPPTCSSPATGKISKTLRRLGGRCHLHGT